VRIGLLPLECVNNWLQKGDRGEGVEPSGCVGGGRVQGSGVHELGI